MSALADPAPVTPDLPLNSIAELRNRHYALLERSDREAGDPAFESDVSAFLAAGSALGKKLSLPAERIEAQRTLDYWASSVSVGGAMALRNAILQPPEATGEKEAASIAMDYVRGLAPGQQSLARRIFLRLLQLEPDGTGVSLPIRHESLLTEGPARAASAEILGRFEKCGLVVRAPEGLRLCGVGVLKEWEEARQWWAQRKRLRDAANFWEAHANDAGALLVSDELIEEAEGYLDRIDLEQKFLDASKQRRSKLEKMRRSIIGVLTILCVVLAVMVFLALHQARRAKDQETLAQTQAGIARAAQTDAEKAKALADIQLADANASRDESEKIKGALLNELATQRGRADKATADLVLLRTDIAALRSSIVLKRSDQERAAALERVERTVNNLDGEAKENSQRVINANRHAEDLAGLLRLPAYRILNDPVTPVTDVRFTTVDPPEVVAGSAGKTSEGATFLWKLDGTLVKSLHGDAGWTRISPDSQWIVTLPYTSFFRAYSRANDWKASQLGSGVGTYTVAAFSPDGGMLATGANGKVELWDWRKGAPAAAAWSDAEAKNSVLTSLVFSRDGRRFAVSSDDGHLLVYEVGSREDAAAGARVWRKETLPHPAREVTFSTDGSWMAARTSQEIWIYSGADPETPAAQLAYPQGVVSANFSPDGIWLACLAADGSLYLHHHDSARAWPLVQKADAHQPGQTGALRWSPSGKYLATGGGDARILIWDTSTFGSNVSLQPAMDLRGHAAQITAIQFTADDHYLASGGGSSVRLWDFQNIRTWQKGRFKSFDGAAFAADDELALVRNWKEADATHVFLPGADRRAGPFTRQLDPQKCYIAARWDYKVTPRQWLLGHEVSVLNAKTGAIVSAQPVDWGPGEASGFLMHISPGVIKALGLNPDDEAAFFVPPSD